MPSLIDITFIAAPDDGSDRWTDPGESNVKDGTAYKANSTTNNKEGTLPAGSSARGAPTTGL